MPPAMCTCIFHTREACLKADVQTVVMNYNALACADLFTNFYLRKSVWVYTYTALPTDSVDFTYTKCRPTLIKWTLNFNVQWLEFNCEQRMDMICFFLPAFSMGFSWFINKLGYFIWIAYTCVFLTVLLRFVKLVDQSVTNFWWN